MPEYLAPGVYVEETSYRTKSIEGQSTSTAGFIGPTRFGPSRGVPEVLTSFADFERIYGGMEQLAYDNKMHNYIAHAIRGFFGEGGSRVYLSRTFLPKSATDDGVARLDLDLDGTNPPAAASTSLLSLRARYPGAMGNMRATFTLRCGLNVLGADTARPTGNQNILRGVNNYDLVWVTPVVTKADPNAKPPVLASAPPDVTQIYWLDRTLVNQQVTYLLRKDAPDGDQTGAKKLDALDPKVEEVHVITINVAVAFAKGDGKFGPDQLFPGLSLHPAHASALSTVFAEQPATKATALYVPLVVPEPKNAYQLFSDTILKQKDASGSDLSAVLTKNGPAIGDVGVSFQVQLTGGDDGLRPTANEYEGDEGNEYAGMKSGLFTFQDVDDISMVAAPGATYTGGQGADVSRLLLAHCAKMRYRAAVLDAPNGMIVSEIRAYRSQFDSTYGALYYPWLRILDPVTQREISLPPSGFVAGIWARTDGQTGVHKAPANEVVRLASGLEIMLNKGQQDVLNPEGINCFRSFEGRGIRLWGARTISSDSEWKYVNLRRYFAYLEHSIDKATQWVVFESNGPSLWDKVKTSVEDFLFNEWKNDRLLGTAAAEAYFVRCDKATMTQNDLDNGRLIVQVGVSPLRPAEFVVFQIGQWTATK